MEVGKTIEAKPDLCVAHGFDGEVELARRCRDVREVVVLAKTAGRIEVKLEDALAQRPWNLDSLPRLWARPARITGQSEGLALWQPSPYL